MRRRVTEPPAPAAPAAFRCAIYTRKSTEEGLEQEFNSLDAQREACESFVASQRGEGWELLPDRYDDGGYSGGNTERPALKRLMADVEAGRVQAVVVYKLDRLSRSLLDFTKLMEVFDARKVAFVSVTQQFNTATSMGRLVLHILLSFAQFEREMISERTRDKMSAARHKGKWVATARRATPRQWNDPVTQGRHAPTDSREGRAGVQAARGRQRPGRTRRTDSRLRATSIRRSGR